MKRIYLTLFSTLLTIPLLAQTQYDYYDDDKVGGGINTVANGMAILILLVVGFFGVCFVLGLLLKVYYWFNPEASPEYQAQQRKKQKENEELLRKWNEEQNKRKERLAQARKEREAQQIKKEEAIQLVEKPKKRWFLLTVKGLQNQADVKTPDKHYTGAYFFTEITSVSIGNVEFKDEIGYKIINSGISGYFIGERIRNYIDEPENDDEFISYMLDEDLVFHNSPYREGAKMATQYWAICVEGNIAPKQLQIATLHSYTGYYIYLNNIAYYCGKEVKIVPFAESHIMPYLDYVKNSTIETISFNKWINEGNRLKEYGLEE